MKRRWILAVIAAALSFAIAGGGLAAEKVINPFTDVPAGHWSYDAINSLVKARVIDVNAGAVTNLTRYEMAELVARAMTRQDKADADSLAQLEKLKKEFRLELVKMGAMAPPRQTASKKEDKTTWSAEIRTRYNNHTLDNPSRLTKFDPGKNQTLMRTRLSLKGEINKEWTYYGRWENEQDLRNSGSQGTTDFNVAYVEGSVFGGKLALGRFAYTPAYGLVIDSYFDGVRLSMGNRLKATFFYGTDDNQSTSVKQADAGMMKETPAGSTGRRFLVSNRIWGAPALSTTSSQAAIRQPGAVRDTSTRGVELAYEMGPTSMKALYLVLDAPGMIPEAQAVKARFMEVGFESKLNDIWTLTGIYSRSNADNNNTGRMLGLRYKNYNLAKPGSFNVYTTYRKLGRFSTYYSYYYLTNITSNLTYDMASSNVSGDYDASRIHGSKGFEYGFNYVFAKNALLNCYLITARPTDDAAHFSQKMFRTDLYWFF
jgi:hypothetical protein